MSTQQAAELISEIINDDDSIGLSVLESQQNQQDNEIQNSTGRSGDRSIELLETDSSQVGNLDEGNVVTQSQSRRARGDGRSDTSPSIPGLVRTNAAQTPFHQINTSNERSSYRTPSAGVISARNKPFFAEDMQVDNDGQLFYQGENERDVTPSFSSYLI